MVQKQKVGIVAGSTTARQEASKLMRRISIGIVAMITLMCTLLAYFINVHPTIERQYGYPVAWAIIGVIGTLLAISLLFLIIS